MAVKRKSRQEEFDEEEDPDEEPFDPKEVIKEAKKKIKQAGNLPGVNMRQNPTVSQDTVLSSIEPMGTLADDWLKSLATQLDPVSTANAASWKPQIGPQSEAFYSKAQELFYGGAAGGGKLVHNGSRVVTPFGWKLAEDIKKGDLVIDKDGGTTKVIGVYPHKDIDLYKFTFIDGAQITVGGDHLWFYWQASYGFEAERTYILYSPEKGIHEESVRGRMGTSYDLYELHKKQVENQEKGKRPYWLIIPLCKPVKYTRPTKTRQGDVIRIDPYLLGLLIGDGTITGRSALCITTIDQFIVDEVKEMYKEDVHWDNKKTIRINGKSSIQIERELNSYGLLGHTAIDKFIPDQYLYANVEVRFRLMQGLINTDGYIDDRGHLSYTTISERLAKNVQQLAWSLGTKASISKKKAGYRDENGSYIECNDAYNIWIQGENLENFVSLPRKKERLKSFNGGVSEPGRRITDIEYVGKGDGVCFAIDHYSGLHVVQDFIVTHNSDLMLGLALSELSPHKKAIIFRRSYPELKDIVTRAIEIVSGRSGEFKGGNRMIFEGLTGGKTLELGSVPTFSAAQKYKGRPHDLKLFDEVSDLSERSYTFLIGWARTTEPGVPVRVVAAGNPPTNSEGQWVVRRWAPWLDPKNANPAKPGEIRWFATLDGEDKEVESEEPFDWKGELIQPKSRTFIPAKLADNAYLANTDYRAVLQNMPEPYRSQLLYGDFMLLQKDDPWQVIPTEWLKLSQKAYVEYAKSDQMRKMLAAMPVFGLDVAEGGQDETALCKMVGNVIHYIEYIKDADIMKQADYISAKMRPTKRAPIAVDSIGLGLGLAQRLQQLGHTVVMVKGSRSTKNVDRLGQFTFANLRAELWWRLREALDPNGVNPLLIPDDKKVFTDLTSAKYHITPSGHIQIERNSDIVMRSGRSPDGAIAAMLALYVSRLQATPLRIF